jgi:hypothetical protein
MKTRLFLVPFLVAPMLSACGLGSSSEGIDSEAATSVVSGALNNTSGSTLGMNDLPKEHPTMFARLLDALNPISTAWAAMWSCTPGTLSPAYAGAAKDPYAFTPAGCSISWLNGRSASSKWNGTFTVNYGAMCSTTSPTVAQQPAGCTITRTGDNTRALTGPDNSAYSVTHDTSGSGTGWDASVSPAPSNGGVVLTCGAGGCASGATLVISGSHLTGTITAPSGKQTTLWDHTVSTGQNGLSVTTSGSTRTVSGTVTVQHNILKYTAQATLNNVTYGDANCCFPTGGSLSTTFSSGTNAGKTETLSFSAACGEATLTTAHGQTMAYTLQHCL